MSYAIPLAALLVSLGTLLVSQVNQRSTNERAADRDFVHDLEKRISLCEEDRKNLASRLRDQEKELAGLRNENRELLVRLVNLETKRPPRPRGTR